MRRALLCVCGLLTAGMVCAEPEAVPWQQQKSDHFILIYQSVPDSFIQEVVDSAEAYYQDTMTTLGFTRYKGWTWSERVKIRVYDSRRAYTGSSHYAWSAGQVNPATREIATFPSQNGFFDSTLPHELGHIIFHEAVGFGDNIPLWLDEGVAMYQEKARRLGADDAVRAMIADGTFIPLAALDSTGLDAGTDQTVVQAFYTEAASLVGFMINKYETYRFERLCRELKLGTPFAWALKKAYMEFDDLEALEKAWNGYLNETTG